MSDTLLYQLSSERNADFKSSWEVLSCLEFVITVLYKLFGLGEMDSTDEE